MKKVNLKISVIALLFITSTMLVINACKRSPLEGLVVTVSPDAISAASLFSVVDAATGVYNSQMENATITITGPAAGLVYNSGGSKTIKISGGVFSISYAKAAVASTAAPLKYNIEIALSGYNTIVYPMVVTSLNPIQETISMMDLSNLPKGVSSKLATITSNINGVTAVETVVDAPANTNKAEKADITIPVGVKMMDANGNAVTGNVNVNLIHISPTSLGAINALGNTTNNTIIDANGNILPQTGIAYAGSLQIEMEANGVAVKTFDKPIKARIEIAKGVYNKKSGKSYAEGDQIDILSQSKGSNNWVKENTATIQKDGSGKLYAEFNIMHLSTWVAANAVTVARYISTQNFPQLNPSKNYHSNSFIFAEYLYYIDEFSGDSAIARNVPINLGIKNGKFVPYNNIPSNVIKVNFKSVHIIYWEEVVITYADAVVYTVDEPFPDAPEAPNLDLEVPLPPFPIPFEEVVPVNIYAFGKYSNAKRILLPNHHIVKYMPTSSYVTGTLYTSSLWQTLNLGVGNPTSGIVNDHNKISVLPNRFTVGTSYKFATEYNGQIYYKDYVMPALSILTATPLEINVGNNCK